MLLEIPQLRLNQQSQRCPDIGVLRRALQSTRRSPGRRRAAQRRRGAAEPQPPVAQRA